MTKLYSDKKFQETTKEVAKLIKQRKTEKERCRLQMADNIIKYVLADPDDPPTAKQLLKWVESMGGGIFV
jgi:hypothetical protein